MLLNVRFSPFLSSFGTHLISVNFKSLYFEWFFRVQIDDVDIAMSGHKYNNLGWFGYSTSNFVYNSSGVMFILASMIFIVVFVYSPIKLLGGKLKSINCLIVQILIL